MSGIIGWIAGKIKWLLLIAAVGGPVVAYMSWQDGERVKKVVAEGIEAQASVEGATRTKRRRSGTSYTVDLAWKDASGQDRKAEKVSISHQFANRIISNDRLTVDTLPIKYLATEQGKDSVIIRDDADQQADLDHEMIYVGAGAGIIGILGSGLWFLLGRRRPEAETEQPAA
jgi:hypothetical protein